MVPQDVNEGERFTIEELGYAETKLNPGRAPGHEEIPAEVVKPTIFKHPEHFLATMNLCLK